MSAFPPSTIAELDQSIAQISDKLDILVSGFGYAAQASGASCTEESILYMSFSLTALTSHESCAELLACAIERLHRAQ